MPSPQGSSQNGARSIVYELDTLRHKGRRGLEQLSLVILCSCANKSQTNTTGQCQVAAGSIWDGPRGRAGVGCGRSELLTPQELTALSTGLTLSVEANHS